jgi:ribosome-associated protein
MIRAQLRTADFLQEIKFTASRSSGAGGQHVNKVSSRITLRWPVSESSVLSEDEKTLLLKKLASRITDSRELVIHVQESRSQHTNRELALEQLDELLATALKPVKKRKKTKPTKTSVTKRLDTKRKHAERKSSRKPYRED